MDLDIRSYGLSSSQDTRSHTQSNAPTRASWHSGQWMQKCVDNDGMLHYVTTLTG